MREKSPQPHPGKARTILSVLRQRNYRFYWLGHFSSVLAQNMEMVAQSWLVLQLTNSPLLLGLTGLTNSIPTIALTLVGGVMADRTDRRGIVLFAQGITAAFFFILATLVISGRIRLWHILLLAFLSGCLRAFERPSRLALLPQTISKEEMPSAVALAGTIWQLNRLIGPAVAGMLIYLVDVGPTYYACFLSSVAALICWYLIRIQGYDFPGRQSGLFQHMMDGLRFIRSDEVFYIFIAMTFFNSVFGMSYSILMPVFARDILLVGSQGFGFLQSAGGAGALGGTIMVAASARWRRKGLQAVSGAIVFGMLLVGFGFSSSYPLSLVLVLLIGLASQFYMTTISTILQLKLPDQFRGRVMGIFGLTWDLMPVGGAVAGTMAEYTGAPVAVAFGGFWVMAMALWVVLRLPGVREVE
jgi:MFS family permease